jgi:hypothetical protein
MLKHRKFFAKALPKSYVKNFLLTGRKSFAERISPKIKSIGEKYFKKLYADQTDMTELVQKGRSMTPRP